MAKLTVLLAATGCLAATCDHPTALLPMATPATELPVRVAAPTASAAPAGSVLDQVYQDGSYPFSVHVGEGWVAHPGTAEAALRVELEHVSTTASLEVWVFHESPTAPRPRAGCSWSFSDQGAYELLRAADARSVATCVPDDPERPLVLGTYMVRGALAYHFELEVPPGRLFQARRAADELLQGVAFY